MIAALLCCAAALAGERPVHVAGEVGTDFPWDVGGRVTLELPGRLRLMAAVGWMPRAYLHVINEGIIGLGGYDRRTADLVEDTLASSLVLRFHGGWRPFPRAGLYLQGGYGIAALGGTASGADVLSMALDVQVPDWIMEGNDFDVTSGLGLAEVEIGWEGRIWRGLSWRAALGGVWTVSARTEVEPTFDPWLIEPLVDDWCAQAEGELSATLERWVRSPVVTVGLGWRAF